MKNPWDCKVATMLLITRTGLTGPRQSKFYLESKEGGSVRKSFRPPFLPENGNPPKNLPRINPEYSDGVDLKLGRETLSLAFPSSGMRQAFRRRPAFTKALTASATI